MSPLKKATTAAQRYDTCRLFARDNRLPPGYPAPQPTQSWPAENVSLLERYQEWLLAGGASPKQVYSLYIPMAGNALGLNLKPHPEISLDGDLDLGLEYVKAKQMSDEWIDMCRVSLEKFRRFLRQERGLAGVTADPPDLTRYHQGLPGWLVDQLQRYQHLRQQNWRPSRLKALTLRFWSGHVRLWRWLVEHRGVVHFADLTRKDVLDYVDHRLAAGYAASGINNDLRCLHGFLCFLEDQGFEVPQPLFRLPSLKQPDSLPKFLRSAASVAVTDEQVGAIRHEIEAQVARAAPPSQKRDALLDRAAFYLLWHGGLRLGELEELRMEDLDLPGRRLTVREGKGVSDRTVYLTDTAARSDEIDHEFRACRPLLGAKRR